MLDLMRNCNPSREDISDWKELPNGKLAHRLSILTTSYVAYSVWEPATPCGTHSTIQLRQDGSGWIGDITTRALPAETDALPYGSAERCQRVDAWYYLNKTEAEAIIRAAFPEDFDTFPTDQELEAFYREESPYYECHELIRVTGLPRKWHVIQNVHHSAYSWKSIISYTNILPIYDTREDALRALATITVLSAFSGLYAGKNEEVRA